jgi:tRNA A-37 threonylcarbamoyl transferase component Bud32
MPKFVSLDLKDTRWTVRSEVSAFLTPHFLGSLLGVERSEEVPPTRRLPSRTTICLPTGRTDIPALYVKVFHPEGVTGRIKNLLWSRADREWKASRELERRGVPTPRVLARGEAKNRLSLRRYLVSEGLPKAHTLKDYLEEGHYGRLEPQKKIETIKEFARFVAKVHKNGIDHRDFHWENMLVRDTGDGENSLYVIDLHCVRVRHELTLTRRIEALATLNLSLDQRTTKTQRLRFLKEYARSHGNLDIPYGHLAKKVEERTGKKRKNQWIKRAKRCLKTNRRFRAMDLAGMHGFASRDLSQEGLASALRDFNFGDGKKACSIIKRSHATVSALLSRTGEYPDLYVKYYPYRGPLSALKNLFRRSRARRCWVTANALILRGVPTAKPLVFLEDRRYLWLRQSLFLTERISPGTRLREYVDETWGNAKSPSSLAEKRRVIEGLAKAVALMHGHGASHGDLKATNVLIQARGNGPARFFFCDLDSARAGRRTSRRRRIRDLARINASFLNRRLVSRTDRVRFLFAYLGPTVAPDALRAYWRYAYAATARKLAKSGRRFA